MLQTVKNVCIAIALAIVLLVVLRLVIWLVFVIALVAGVIWLYSQFKRPRKHRLPKDDIPEMEFEELD